MMLVFFVISDIIDIGLLINFMFFFFCGLFVRDVFCYGVMLRFCCGYYIKYFCLSVLGKYREIMYNMEFGFIMCEIFGKKYIYM